MPAHPDRPTAASNERRQARGAVGQAGRPTYTTLQQSSPPTLRLGPGVRSCLAVATSTFTATATSLALSLMACVEKMFNVRAIMTLMTHYEAMTASLLTVTGLNTRYLSSFHCFRHYNSFFYKEYPDTCVDCWPGLPQSMPFRLAL